MAAFFVWLCIVSLAITKIGRSCVRFKEGNYYQAKKNYTRKKTMSRYSSDAYKELGYLKGLLFPSLMIP